MGSTAPPLFIKDKPLFGLDVGTGSVKVMQIAYDNKKRPSVSGYGKISFDSKAVKEGEIVDLETVAKATLNLFENHLIGTISTNRVALCIPARRTYARELVLPNLSGKELQEAVLSEAEQYIPRSLDELYLDSDITSKTPNDINVYTAAAPQKIINSYVKLAHLLGLEPLFIEPSMSSDARLMTLDEHSSIPSVLIDFGGRSADIAIFNKNISVNGTVQSGGDLFTERIMESLKVTHAEANTIKTKYGLGLSKKQAQIRGAIEPLLQQTTREIRRMIRYYEERADMTAKIGQVITMGGGANMPGLADYLTENLRLPVRMFDPWQVLDFGKLQPPAYADRSIYMSVAGLGLVRSKEIFA